MQAEATTTTCVVFSRHQKNKQTKATKTKTKRMQGKATNTTCVVINMILNNNDNADNDNADNYKEDNENNDNKDSYEDVG